MTDTQTAPVPALDFTAWDQKEREQIRMADELLPANKTALFDALAAAGIGGYGIGRRGFAPRPPARSAG